MRAPRAAARRRGGEVRVVLAVADGRASLTLDPSGEHAGTATIVLGYPDALAMARGELDPADALAAGRVRVRGDLAALVAGQDVLVAAADTDRTRSRGTDRPGRLPGRLRAALPAARGATAPGPEESPGSPPGAVRRRIGASPGLLANDIAVLLQCG